jgi:putative ABC transport system permease protein
VAKLADGKTIEDAKAEMAVVATRLEQQHPDTNRSRGARVMSVTAGMLDEGMKPILSLWQASAGFVLLIACANIASLLLARGAERQREMALRVALGASRMRIVRQLLIESLVLALSAVPAAIAVAWVGITLIRINLPARIVRFVDGWSGLDVDLRLIAFTAVLAGITTVIFGLIPALQASRPQLGETLKEGGRSSTGGRRRQWLRRGLVVAEIALALPLLVASGLAALGTQRFLHGSQGYDSEGILTMRAVLPEAKYAEPESRLRFVEGVLANLSALPGVERIAVSNVIPSGNNNSSRAIEVEGQPVVDRANPPIVDYRAVTPDYFDTLRIPLVKGRGFTTADGPHTQPVVVVSESMAARYFPGQDAIGRRIRLGTGQLLTIVGVSGDIIQDWYNRRNYPTVYRSYLQAPTFNLAFVVRARGDLAALQRPAAAAVTTVDAAQPLYDVMSMKRLLNERTIGLQYISAIMAVFGGLALVLAVVGVYSLMAFFVTQRRHEIGVRIALGATRHDVLRLAVGHAALLTTLGVAVGLGLSLGLSRLMEAGLLGVVSSDARVALTFAAVLVTAALAAGYIPARRATVIDPIIALRAD